MMRVSEAPSFPEDLVAPEIALLHLCPTAVALNRATIVEVAPPLLEAGQRLEAHLFEFPRMKALQMSLPVKGRFEAPAAGGDRTDLGLAGPMKRLLSFSPALLGSG